MSTVITLWAPLIGYERRSLPSTSDSWSPTDSPVARFILSLRVLNLEDPTRASEFYRNALALREHAIVDAAKPNEEAAIAERLARGEVSPAEAAKLLSRAPRPADAHEQAERARQMVADAARAAYGMAVREVHQWGEDKWLGWLRPLIAEAVAAQDEERFASLHRFAGLLRDHTLGALAMVASDPSGVREVEDVWRYAVGRPDRYHQWRLERAEAAQPVGTEMVGDYVFVASVVTKGPHPTLAEMVAGDMEPGIYSAAEVLAIKDRILAEQEGAVTTAQPPAQQKKRRVVLA